MAISIRPENCDYRAEGNAGIVVGLIQEGTVLKLKKQDNFSEDVPSSSKKIKQLENEVKIAQNVLKPILGESFVNIPVIVFLKAEELQILNQAISRFRPAHRKHKSVREVDMYVCMLPDYCCLPHNLKNLSTYGPLLCFEIKPKQGFTKEEYLPSKVFAQPRMCRFCMMQKYKLMKGSISSKSGYCPTDLYSGCYQKMFHALKMLFETPQNNLRIFKNQKLIYSEEKREGLNEILSDFVPSGLTRSVDMLCDLLIQALVKPCGMENAPIYSHKKFSQKCINTHTVPSDNELCHKLPLYCVLERILHAQLLDDMPIIHLYKLYLQLKDKRDGSSDLIGCYSRSEIPPYVGQLNRADSESEFQYASRKVWEFLLALVMKDCSIMITLKHLAPNSSNETFSQNTISDKHGNLYIFSIAIADLDAKSLEKVEKVYTDLTFILESFEGDAKFH